MVWSLYYHVAYSKCVMLHFVEIEAVCFWRTEEAQSKEEEITGTSGI